MEENMLSENFPSLVFKKHQRSSMRRLF